MRSQKRFVDSAEAPIIAIDFDGTINVGGEGKYPECGEVRPFAKRVINYMHDLGIKIVIWTSRDVAYNQEEKKMYDHLTPMLNFLDENEIHYDAINKSVQFAPYHYNGRKVYANMYVDDRAFGWKESDDVMLLVLQQVLIEVCGFDHHDAKLVVLECRTTDNDPQEWMKEVVKHWKDWMKE